MSDSKDDKKKSDDPTGGASFDDVVKTFLRKKPQSHKRKRDESDSPESDKNGEDN